MAQAQFNPGDKFKFNEGFGCGLVLPDGGVIILNEVEHRRGMFAVGEGSRVPADAWHINNELELPAEARIVFKAAEIVLKHVA